MQKFLIAVLIFMTLSAVPVSAAPVSFNAKEMDLHDTIMMIADMGGLNVSVDDSVKGVISISLDNVEPVDALNIISKTRNLNMIEENGIFIITGVYLGNALMDPYTLPILHGNAETFRESIINLLDLEQSQERKEDKQQGLYGRQRVYRENGSYTYEYVPNGFSGESYKKVPENKDRVKVNKDINAIILYGTSTEYKKVKKLLSEIDIPIKQVSLEAKVMAINKSAAKDLGIEWKWSEIPKYPDYTPPTLSRKPIYDNNGNIVGYDYVYTGERYTRNHGNDGYGIIKFGGGPNNQPYEMYYGAKLNALITNGKAKMLSRPNITTIQGNEAVMSVGDRIPVPRVDVSNSVTTTSYSYEESGIILRVNPRINEDGSITANVYTEVSVPQYVPAMGVYRFNKRSANTIVTLKDGEPMVIGGLIGKEEEKSISKIPFLGDLPILGALFRNHHKSKSESELMIFLTAHVIK